jgi:hypothetical protein
MAKLMGTFLKVITNVPNRNVTDRRQNIGQRPENWMQSATWRQRLLSIERRIDQFCTEKRSLLIMQIIRNTDVVREQTAEWDC